MKSRTGSWVAWSLAALMVLFTVAHVTLAQPIPGAVDTRGQAGLPIAFTVVGPLIVTHQAGRTVAAVP